MWLRPKQQHIKKPKTKSLQRDSQSIHHLRVFLTKQGGSYLLANAKAHQLDCSVLTLKFVTLGDRVLKNMDHREPVRGLDATHQSGHRFVSTGILMPPPLRLQDVQFLRMLIVGKCRRSNGNSLTFKYFPRFVYSLVTRH